MRFRIVACGVAVAVAIGLSGCGSSNKSVASGSGTSTAPVTITNDSDCVNGTDTVANVPCTPAPPGSTSTDTTDTTDTTPSAPVPVGQSQTLQDSNGDPIEVTVVSVQPFQNGDGYSPPSSGTHWVGVTLTWKNSGTTDFSDAPDNEVKLIDTNGNSITSDVYTGSECQNDANMHVPASESRRGCVAFQVSDNATLKTVEVALDSGNATPGDWTIK
jgi:hypothetical protein